MRIAIMIIPAGKSIKKIQMGRAKLKEITGAAPDRNISRTGVSARNYYTELSLTIGWKREGARNG